MKLILDSTKTVDQNAAAFYAKASKFREKAQGAKKQLEVVERQLAREEKRDFYKTQEPAVEKKPKVRIKRQVEWYERFHWFFTSSGLLAIGGRDAAQNETVFKSHADPERDSFFHADVHGAPVVILKDGQSAKEADKKEAAQFAVSYSSAWKNGFGSADAYCLPVSQVSKSAKSGEYVGKGGFVMEGKREWFRNTELKIVIGIDEKGRVCAQPMICKREMKNKVVLVPGGKEKGVIAKETQERTGAQLLDEILLLVPPGKSEIEE